MDFITRLNRTWTGRFILGGSVALFVFLALGFGIWYLYHACVIENKRFDITEADLELRISGAESLSGMPAKGLLTRTKENEREKLWNVVVLNVSDNRYNLRPSEVKKVNLFAIDYERLRNAVASYPTVRSAEVEMQLPNRLIIRVTPRSPVAILANPNYVCDRFGMVMERNNEEVPPNSPLPMIVGMPQKAFRSGVPIEKDIGSALNLIEYVVERSDLGIRLVKVNMRDPDRRGIMSMVFYYRQNEMARERIYLAELPTDRNRLPGKIEELVSILRNLNRTDTPNGYNYIRLIYEPRPVLARVSEIELRSL